MDLFSYFFTRATSGGGGGSPTLITKQITENGTYTAADDNADGYSEVEVNVDGTDIPVSGVYFTKPDSNGNPTECNIIGYAPINNYTWSNQLSGSYFPYLTKVSFIKCKNITIIGDQAFRNCTSLTTINLPDSIINIGDNAFFNCTSLTPINLPNSITIIGAGALRNCTSLTTINLPNSITRIGDNAFWGCTSLTTIELPNSITRIGNYAFWDCTSLTDVSIKNGFNCNGLNLSASTRYTAETIIAWLEALADRTGQEAYRLTIGTTNLNKLTAEQKAIATNKNWTLA